MRPSRRPIPLSWMLAAVLAWAASGMVAVAGDPYRVELIPVDATAADAVAARAEAIARGEREGLTIVMERLTMQPDGAGLPDPAGINLDRVVRSYDVAEEQVASNRYVAKINVTYNPAEVRRILAGTGLAFVQKPPQPVLVVPATRSASGGVSLWSDDDPWRAAWLGRNSAAGLLDVVLPLGDVEDIATFPPQALEGGDTAALATLAQRYEASAAYVAAALIPSAGIADGAPVRVDVLGPGLGEPLQSEIVPAGPGATEAESLGPVVAAAVGELEAAWKTQNLAAGTRVSKLSVEVPLADLRGWVQIRRELETLPLVRSLRIDSLDRAQANVTIDYSGELQQFESAVARLGLMLAQENGQWRLLPAGGRVGDEAPAPATMPRL